MPRPWRDFLTGGGYLVLIPAIFGIDEPRFQAAALAAVFLFALTAWLLNLRRLRAIRDMPTSRVASAAQGYVELSGLGRELPDQPVYSPTHRLPCLWYRYRAFSRDGDQWRQTESGESQGLILLDDGSGLCLLDPIGAEILCERKETYESGEHKVEEELLLAGDKLYALGDFSSRDGGHTRFDERQELSNILAEWKEDKEELHRRFDLDGNGEIDPQEWQLARQAAQREMETRKAEALARPVTHLLSRPRHGRPYLIANFPPEHLASRYRRRTVLHGLAAVTGLVGLAMAAQTI